MEARLRGPQRLGESAPTDCARARPLAGRLRLEEEQPVHRGRRLGPVRRGSWELHTITATSADPCAQANGFFVDTFTVAAGEVSGFIGRTARSR
jgi:hypothetical protein